MARRGSKRQDSSSAGPRARGHKLLDKASADTTAAQVRAALAAAADKQRARDLQRFFKTGPGDYGEGDVFLGVIVPVQRKVAKRFQYLALRECETLLHSPVHEHRLTALLICCLRFPQGQPEERKAIVDFYLRNTQRINNWDLVDLSAPNLLGQWLLTQSKQHRSILYERAKSSLLWDRRIAIVATHAFIRAGQCQDTIAIAEMLLEDKHDLMHKAVGWMLREAGKRDMRVLTSFLDKHATVMPRTMLRYAIERLSESERKRYMRVKGVSKR